LREITAQTVRSLAGLPAETPLPPPAPADAEQWVQMALKQNPSLQAAKFSVEDAQETVRLQRGLGYPTVDLVGTLSESDTSKSDISGTERTATSISLGAIDSATRRAAAQLEQAKETLEQTRRSITRQTRETYLNVLATISRANALKQAVVSQKSALAATEAGYEIGTRTTVDVLNARTLLFASQRDFTQSRYDYVLGTLQLQSAAGSLGAEDLQQANSWLKK
jgi:outer membrane protein